MLYVNAIILNVLIVKRADIDWTISLKARLTLIKPVRLVLFSAEQIGER